MATDKSTTPGLRLPWAGKQVSPELVEEELTSLWHLAADNMRISQNMNVRTSVLNLVICVSDVQSAYKVSTLLRDLSSTHIARVTLLILDTRSDQPSNVSTWVTLRSFSIISDVMRHHFEQIVVHMSGEAVHSSAPIVSSLLKPDLPVYLWWPSDLPADPGLFHQLTRVSSRVIVDSDTFLVPEQRIRTLSSLLQETPDCALSDLSWGRITSWRELVAQFFDVAEYRSYLGDVDTIEIEHSVLPATSHSTNAVSPNPIRALLLAAWLKTRLGWKLSSDTSHNLHETETGTYSWKMARVTTLSGHLLAVALDQVEKKAVPTLTISVRPRENADLSPGSLCLVRMRSTSGDQHAAFTIDREDDKHVLTAVELPSSSRPQRTVNITATQKEDELLHNEFEIMGQDLLYEDTLHEVFSLLA
ncbi:glucose-6-phosphate dehydrogenase assembly protein OpcA [Tengunoibacter tsumagoiensis]|uniref:Glucose-6-phosphate dehydrogenase n=1 Tax=Tengunoibacter tsumagoiensis TaxID=2014871 RepID=A0A402A312_9CHLR|nr:glucose-6-phosphate dehydrogenase assembly protein OpcA [Tengunoibacter tsumagoiensis]GCE13429.1 hypothetical protein KTT_32880 [Tengunoibacter tsumagoiensis]